MRERFRLHAPPRHLLDVVVANRRGRMQGGLHVSGFQQSTLLRGVGPNAREAIRLQLRLHRQRIRSRWIASLQLLHSALYAKDLLNVVANFVRQHISLREFTRRPNRLFNSS